MEKVCTKCLVRKSSVEFSARKKSPDGLASRCRLCFQENWRKRYYENHEHYRSHHNASRTEIRRQNARRVFEYLRRNPCVNCGEADPVVLEFDHRDKDDKIENIANLIRDATWRHIKSEIEKCDVPCANCHRRKSAAQFNYLRHVFLNS